MANPIRSTAESLKGMGITLKNFFRKPVTVQYPEQVRKLPARVRGRHVLHRYENGLERCIACMLCSGSCPADAIYIEPAENDPAKPNSFGERYAEIFQVDMLRCIFCGYCQMACPTGAITLESNTASGNFQPPLDALQQGRFARTTRHGHTGSGSGLGNAAATGCTADHSRIQGPVRRLGNYRRRRRAEATCPKKLARRAHLKRCASTPQRSHRAKPRPRRLPVPPADAGSVAAAGKRGITKWNRLF